MQTYSGSNETASIHMNGLQQLVMMRGDMHTKHIPPVLQRLIMLADVVTSNAARTSPRFRANEPKPTGSDSPPSAVHMANHEHESITDPSFFTSKIGLDFETTKMFIHLQRLTSQADSFPDKMPGNLIEDVHKLEIYIESLTHSSNPEHRRIGNLPATEICIYTGYMYLYLFLLRLPVQSQVFVYALNFVKEALTDSSHDPLYLGELLFWILFVASVVANETQNETWFFERLAVCSKSMQFTEWTGAKLVLKKFAWGEKYGEVFGRKAWDKLQGFS